LPLIPAERRRLPLAPEHAVRASDRAAVPRYVVWELTLKCDLSCRHCGSRAGKPRPDELGTDEALKLVDDLHALGTREITLIGGEAYLHDGWLVIARRIHELGMAVSILTGGLQMTRDRLVAARDAGVGLVAVSIDAGPALHDELRGKRGSHAAAMRTLEDGLALGMRMAANTQITAPALREVEPMIRGLIDRGIAGWQVSMTVPMGRAADEPELLLQPWQVLEVLPMLARVHAYAAERSPSFVLFPGNDIGYFGPYEALLHPNDPGQHRQACAAGKHGMGIEADGAIKGCPSLPSRDYVGGRVRDAPLAEIWRRAEALRFTRERTTEGLWGFCATCYYKEPCMGGCTWTAHVLFGRPGNNPYCHHRAIELLREGKRERVVRVEAAPGSPFDQGRFELVVEDWPAEERRVAEAVVAERATSLMTPLTPRTPG
jgi:radical SAM protein with 4Fe4S-binding SPASM domain